MPDEGVEVKPPPGVERKSSEKPAEKGQEPSREKSPWREWIAEKLRFLEIPGGH